MKKLLLLILPFMFISEMVIAQCPQITCPADITVNNETATCNAVVNYAMPQGINPCGLTTLTFTNCGAIERLGPTQSAVNAAYNGTPLQGLVTVNTQGIQEFVVPVTGTYLIEAKGAKGGGINGGLGASMAGEFNLTQGQVIKILVGQQGSELTTGRIDFGGGGGTFVTTATNTPLIVAGGGGGAEVPGSTSNASITNNGNPGSGGHSNGVGGTNGSGGTRINQTSDGGAGLTGNGASGNPNPAPQAFINGGAGGCNTWSAGCGAVGGFGGGGAGNRNHLTYRAAGGGGGYSGGGAAYGQPGNLPVAGGGGSFNSGTNQVNTAGVNSGHGEVKITYGTAPNTATTITQISGLPSGSVFPVGTTVNTFVATDALNYTDTCSFSVVVLDIENPTITSPADVIVNTDLGTCSATGVALGSPATTDNCSIANISNDAPSAFPIGNTTVTWTATDASGNTASAIQTVTVVDNEKPGITPPSDIIVNVDPGTCQATGVTLGSPVTVDNCSVDAIFNDAPATYLIGFTEVTWTVTDASGNTSTAAQMVIVKDNEAPVIGNPLPDIEEKCAVAFLTTATAQDICEGLIYGVHDATLPITANTTVTWTYSDASGNISTQTQNVIITGIDVSVVADGIKLTANNAPVAGVSYQWINCAGNVPIAGATKQEFTAIANGDYAVIITEDNCKDTSACYTISTVGMQENSLIDKLRVFPNPTNGALTIDMGMIVSEAKVQIMDLQGRIIAEESALEQRKIDINIDQQPGVYLVYVISDIGIKVTRVVKIP